MNRHVLVLKESETEQLQTGDTIALDRIPISNAITTVDSLVIGVSGGASIVSALDAWQFFNTIINEAITEDGEILREDGKPLIEG